MALPQITSWRTSWATGGPVLSCPQETQREERRLSGTSGRPVEGRRTLISEVWERLHRAWHLGRQIQLSWGFEGKQEEE